MDLARPTQLYIVEDSAAVRSRLVELVGRIGNVNVVGQAGDASSAVADILALRPDSVLLDLDLNGTNGMHVLRAVHTQVPEIVFVVLTNHAEAQYRRACANAGATYFLDKSSEFDRVREVIAEIATTRH